MEPRLVTYEVCCNSQNVLSPSRSFMRDRSLLIQVCERRSFAEIWTFKDIELPWLIFGYFINFLRRIPKSHIDLEGKTLLQDVSI